MALSCCSVESSIFSVHTRRIQIGAHNGVLRGLLFFLPFFPFSGNCHYQFMLIPFLRVRYRIVARIAMLQHGRPDDDNIVWVRSDDVVTHTHTLHNLFLSTLPSRAAPTRVSRQTINLRPATCDLRLFLAENEVADSPTEVGRQVAGRRSQI
jgi:hypothetical protein